MNKSELIGLAKYFDIEGRSKLSKIDLTKKLLAVFDEFEEVENLLMDKFHHFGYYKGDLMNLSGDFSLLNRLLKNANQIQLSSLKIVDDTLCQMYQISEYYSVRKPFVDLILLFCSESSSEMPTTFYWYATGPLFIVADNYTFIISPNQDEDRLLDRLKGANFETAGKDEEFPELIAKFRKSGICYRSLLAKSGNLCSLKEGYTCINFRRIDGEDKCALPRVYCSKQICQYSGGGDN